MAAILLFLDNSISFKNYSKAIIGKSNESIYPENEFRLQVQFEIVTCLNNILCQYRLWMNYFALCVYTVTFTFKSFSFIFSWQIDHMTHKIWFTNQMIHILWVIWISRTRCLFSTGLTLHLTQDLNTFWTKIMINWS